MDVLSPYFDSAFCLLILYFRCNGSKTQGW